MPVSFWSCQAPPRCSLDDRAFPYFRIFRTGVPSPKRLDHASAPPLIHRRSLPRAGIGIDAATGGRMPSGGQHRFLAQDLGRKILGARSWALNHGREMLRREMLGAKMRRARVTQAIAVEPPPTIGRTDPSLGSQVQFGAGETISEAPDWHAGRETGRKPMLIVRRSDPAVGQHATLWAWRRSWTTRATAP